MSRSADDTARQNELAQVMDELHLSPQAREQYQKSLAEKDSVQKRLKISDFETVKVIGRGAFGEVKVARKRDDGTVYAVKTMSKAEMVRQGQVTHIRAERDVLALADNPWVVKLHYSFQDSEYLYLAMEFLMGGDLMTVLMKHDILTTEQTTFYMAELALAIDSVHKLGYFHRDLKPDNVLIDEKGHVKLSDFGLCKAFDDGETPYDGQAPAEGSQNPDPDEKTATAVKARAWKAQARALSYSVVGTPEYIAPEVFAKRGYNEKCDWWSLGVIMYECLVGYPPFYADTPRATCWKIVNWRRALKFPDDADVSADAKDCITRLICSATRRMTFDDIKAHPYFAGVDWVNIRNNPAPLIPKLKGDTDCSCFDDFEDAQPLPDSKERQEAIMAAQSQFVGYTYNRPEVIGSKQAAPAFDASNFYPEGIEEEDEEE